LGWGNLKGGGHLEDLGLDGKIVLKWILEKWDGGLGLDRSVSGQGQVAGCFKCGDEPYGSINCGEFLE
jgi:hypothetical protein